LNDLRTAEFPAGWFKPRSTSYLLAYLDYQLLVRRHIGYPEASYWGPAYREDEKGWREVVAGLDFIGEWARQRQVPALLVLVPVLLHEGWHAGSVADIHARVSRAGLAAGLGVLDLLPVLEVYDVDALRLEPWDTFHLNAEGHRIVAQALSEQLRARGWVPPVVANTRETSSTHAAID